MQVRGRGTRQQQTGWHVWVRRSERLRCQRRGNILDSLHTLHALAGDLKRHVKRSHLTSLGRLACLECGPCRLQSLP